MKRTFSQLVVLTLFALGGAQPTFAQAAPGDDLAEIKQILTEQERTIRALKDRVAELEAEPTPPVAAAADPSSDDVDRAEADEASASVEEVEAVEEQIHVKFSRTLALLELDAEGAIACHDGCVLPYLKVDPAYRRPREIGTRSEAADVAVQIEPPLVGHLPVVTSADDGVRQGIKDFSDWPTIPQLYVKGEFVGGCDIITEMALSGELDTLFDETGVTYDKDAADKIREANG